MTFHNSTQNSMTFQALKAKKQTSMTFQVFQDPYESWFIEHKVQMNIPMIFFYFPRALSSVVLSMVAQPAYRKWAFTSTSLLLGYTNTPGY